MLTILFIVGRTTLFTPVDINLQQVVDFLNFYACRMEAEQKRQAEIEKQHKQQEEMEREQEALRKKMIQQRLVRVKHH